MTTVEQLRRGLEHGRLAHELGTHGARLPALRDVPADELAHLRRQLAAGLVAHHAPVFDAFATASGLVPAVLAASATRRMIGPSLAGRMAGSMSGRRAAAIMSHLDAAFLADACRTLSAEAAVALLPAIDDDQVLATTAELAARGDHATLGRFVDTLDDRRLTLVLDTLRQPHDLLLAGAATDTGTALDRVITLLPAARRAAIVRTAPELPDAAAGVLVRVSATSRGLLLAALLELPDDPLVVLLDRLADVIDHSPALAAAASSLPSSEIAAAAGALDRSATLRSAIGRLTVAVVRNQETP